MAGEAPAPMSGTCGCSLNGHMYIFGGCDEHGQTNQVRLITDAAQQVQFLKKIIK